MQAKLNSARRFRTARLHSLAVGIALLFAQRGFAFDPPPNGQPYLVTNTADVTGDSANDAVVADPSDGAAGEVRVTSGADGELTVILVGRESGDKFGYAAAVVNKLNNDTYKDLVIGAPQEQAGRAYIFHGPFDETCPLILSAVYANLMLQSPDADTFAFGAALNGIPDLNDDAISEVMIRASYTDASGQARHRSYVFSGATGERLYTLEGDATSQGYSGGNAPVTQPSCYGDIAGPDGIPNGVVDVDDLLVVLLGWGPCPPLPTACPGDIAPRTNLNGIVDVDDLLAVLNAWGPCPPLGIAYTSNGTGGGDWMDPNTWHPPGVPGLTQHMDAARIRTGDTITQSQKLPYTMGYYMLDGGTHVFSGEADIAALVVEIYRDGRWLRSGEAEPLIIVRNARLAYKPNNAEVLRVYECSTMCALLTNPRYPYSTLAPCTEVPCVDGPDAP